MQDTKSTTPQLVTARELARILRVSVSHVYEMAGKTIPVLTIGRSKRFELQAVLDALRDGAS